MNTATAQRKRVNFILKMETLRNLGDLIPSGERSSFVDEAINEKILTWGRKKAIEMLNESIKNETHIHTTKEILKILHEDRQ